MNRNDRLSWSARRCHVPQAASTPAPRGPLAEHVAGLVGLSLGVAPAGSAGPLVVTQLALDEVERSLGDQALTPPAAPCDLPHRQVCEPRVGKRVDLRIG